MSSFKKAKSSFDRDEIDPTIQAEISIGQVFKNYIFNFELRKLSQNLFLF
jgi:hypothetical protein